MTLQNILIREYTLFHNGKPDLPLHQASSSDSARAYSKHQERWRQFSTETIKKLLESLAENGTFNPDNNTTSLTSIHKSFDEETTDFERIYLFLANERYEIATELKHGEEESITRTFGQLRAQRYESYEMFYNDSNINQPWKDQKDQVFKETYKVINQNQDAIISDESYELDDDDSTPENDYCTIIKNKIDQETAEEIENFDSGFAYSITIKSPITNQKVNGKNHSQELSSINLLQNPENPLQNLIQIIYTSINKHDRKGDMELADNYFKLLFKQEVDTKKGRQEFLKGMGRLMHLMAHLLPVKRGNAGICEWIMRATAFKNQIELGDFNHEEELSWDFKALLTPSRETYAEWFSKKAFLDMVFKSGPSSTHSLTL